MRPFRGCGYLCLLIFRSVTNINQINLKMNYCSFTIISRFYRSLMLIAAVSLSGLTANAQNITVSGGTTAAGSYISFAAALTAVNGATATGPIIINFDEVV